MVEYLLVAKISCVCCFHVSFYMKILFHIFNADLKCIIQEFLVLKIFYPLICLLLLQNFYGVHLILTSCEYF